MDFKNAIELLELCKKHDLPISEVMRQREIVEGEKEADTVHDAMARVLEIMKNAAFTPIKEPVRSMGGLIGGEAKKIASRYHSGNGICGDLLEKSMIYAMATLETNASMGLIVASPTAGSAGIVPGLLLGLQEVHKFDDEQIIQALFNASAIGYLAMRNATVAGAAGVANAIIAAEISLSGIRQLIPFDEMLNAMYIVGKRLPAELRETAQGGCAATPSACAACGGCA
jgi:L-serine dehydratase